MENKKSFQRFLLLLVLFVFQIQVVNAQIVGTSAYIKGTSLEIGIDGTGGFEGAPMSTSPPPAGMHPRPPGGFFGFVANPQVNGWATYDGDFFTPGTPENGWGFCIGQSGGVGSFQTGNNCDQTTVTPGIPGSITSWTHTFNCYSADWQGNSTNGGNLHWKINYFLQQTDLFYTTTVSVTNNTGATIPDIYYYRNVDPDNDESISGTFVTQNTIVAQPTSGLCNTAHVKATSTLPASQPLSYMGFAASGANWRVGYGGFWNRDAYQMWAGTGLGFASAVGSTASVDQAIFIAYHVINLAPGATETFKFVVILDDLAAAQAVANTTVLSYPGSLTAPPSVCTPWADTVKICQGVPATIGVSGPNTASYNWSWSPTAGLSPATGPSVSANPATTTSYTVTGTPINACFAAITFPFVVQVTPSPTVVAEANVTACAGTVIPINTFASTPAGATFAWTNSNPAIGLAASGATSLPAFTAANAAGAPITSTITVTPTIPGSTCPGIASTFTITVNPSPVTTVNSATICPGQTAALTAGGATSYVWSAGATSTGVNTADASPLVTTSYTVTGTSLTCTSTAVSTVTIGGVIATTVNSPTICAGQTANLIAGGAATYVWSAGATSTGVTTADASPAATTTYTVTGTSGGCTGTAVSTVTVNPIPVVTVTSGTICAGAGDVITAGGATSYTWSAGATSTGVNTASISPATTTSYTVTGTSLGCTSTAVSTETVNPIPTTTVNSPAICPSTTASLTAGGAASYVWSAGATATGVNTATASPAATTTYTVTGTSLGCSSTAVATVTVNPGLTPDAGLDDSVCFGASITLNVIPNGPGYSYSWTPVASLTGPATFNPLASPATTTTYSVTVTDPAGCSGTDNVTIYADPQITMAIAGINVTCNGACNGQTIVIPAGGTPAYTYLWSSGCTGASCTALCPASYTVTVTDSWGCTATASTAVTEPTLLTAATTASTPASCKGVCDGTATAAAAGGTIGAGYSYSWNTLPVQTTATATALCAGSYTCTATDANGCTATTTVTITEPTLVVTAPIAAMTVCSGGSATLTALASGGNAGGYSYNWLPAGTGATASVTVSPAVTTTYTVNAMDLLHSCPAAPVTVTVTVNPPLSVIAAGTASICPGASTIITAAGSFGNGGPYTYTWAPAGTPSGSPLTVSPATTTTYTVTADDGCSPSVTATVTVTVLPLPVVTFASDVTSGCEPLCVNFIDNSTVTGGTISSWNWTFDGTTSSSPTPSHCFMTPGSYNVGLTVTSSLGGCTASSSLTNMITVYPNPIAEFTAPQSTSIINPLVNFTDNSTNAASWNWNFGDTFDTGADTTSSLQNPVHNYSQAGTYCVTLTVTSINGCVNAIPHCLTVDPEFTFFIPNAFSPNGDGVNDEFFGKGDFIIDFEMTIFDRWGNLIFFTDDINKHWDGKANHGGSMAQEDVYVYVVKIKDHKNQKHKYTGTVTIVK